MPLRPGPATAPIQSMSEGAWYERLMARKVTPNPTPKILEEQTLFKQRQVKCPVRRLTETRARLHLLTLERKPDRGAAVRMYQAINPAWPSANSLCNRLSKIASAPWLGHQQADSRGTAATRGVPPPMQVNETLVEPILAAMRGIVGSHQCPGGASGDSIQTDTVAADMVVGG